MLYAIVFAFIALSALLGAGLIYFAKAALTRADGKGKSDAAAVKAQGDSAIDAIKVEEAREAVNEIDAAKEAAEARGHDLEQALVDQAVVASAPDADIDELFKASVSRGSGGTAKGDPRGVAVSDGGAKGSGGPSSVGGKSQR